MKFERERTRAACDLLSSVPLESAETVFDLGCGPGNSVELLLRRFPGAAVVGLDTSQAMLAYARRRAPQAIFVRQDIESWSPTEAADLIFANAALHFLPRHEELFPRLASFLKPGGVLAVQMPNIMHESTHAAMRLVAADGPAHLQQVTGGVKANARLLLVGAGGAIVQVARAGVLPHRLERLLQLIKAHVRAQGHFAMDVNF